MKKILPYLVFAAIILTAAPCRADLTVEQECRSVSRVKTMVTDWRESAYDYSRRIFIKDGFLAVQLIVNNIPTREYGFDFRSKIYYESDLINKEYNKYFFSAINEEYAKRKTMEMGSPERPDRRGGPVGRVGMGFADLKVKSTKAFFAKKKVGELSCVLYRYEIGPGYSPFRPLSWGTDIRAWVTKDIPGYSLYEDVAGPLRKNCGFYLAKSNEISDLILALMYSDGFPVETHDMTRRDYGVGRLFEESHASLVRLDTAPIPDGAISYFADPGAFLLNAAEPAAAGPGSRFGPALNMPSDSRIRPTPIRYASPGESGIGAFYNAAIPVLFFVGLIYIVITLMMRDTSAPPRWGLARDLFVLITVLYTLQLAHYVIPYFIPIEFEVPAVILLGVLIIIGRRFTVGARRARIAAHAENARICPHCGAIIEKIYVECPKCGKRIEAKDNNGA